MSEFLKLRCTMEREETSPDLLGGDYGPAVIDRPEHYEQRKFYHAIMMNAVDLLRHCPNTRKGWMEILLCLLWVAGEEAPLTFEWLCVHLRLVPVIKGGVYFMADPRSLLTARRRMLAIGMRTLQKAGHMPSSFKPVELRRVYRIIKNQKGGANGKI